MKKSIRIQELLKEERKLQQELKDIGVDPMMSVSSPAVEAPEVKRWYVKHSSWFDSHPYPIMDIVGAVKAAGGQKIRKGRGNGWSNQPEVVLFSATESVMEDIKKEIQTTLGTPWIIIPEKDW